MARERGAMCRHSLRRVDSATRRHALSMAAAGGLGAMRAVDTVLCCWRCGLLVLTGVDSPLNREARGLPMLFGLPCCAG